jgi:hypothetical protein
MSRPTHVDLTFGEVTIRFSGVYTPGDSGRHTLPNGDPGYPPTPSEFEWDAAHIGELEVTEMVEELVGLNFDELCSKLLERVEEEADEDFDEPRRDDSTLGIRAGGSA